MPQRKTLKFSEKRKNKAEAKRNKKKNGKFKNINTPTDTELNNLILLYKNKRFNEAEQMARYITKRFPNHPFSWKVLGITLQQTGRINESLPPIQKSVQLAPRDAEAHCNLGATLQELRRFDEAEASCRQAIALKPDFAKAHSNLGGTLKELGRLDEAEASCRQAIALRPDFAEAHGNLGNTYKALGKLDKAEASYAQAIALQPDLAEAHSSLGATLKELGKLEEAEASCKRAIGLKPDFAEAHSNLGATRKELGRLDEAEASCRQAIALNPNFAEAYSNLGAILQELGRLEEAEASCTQAIALKPNFVDAYSNLGNTLQALGRLEEAEASYTQAIELEPNHANVCWNLHGIQKNIKGAEHWIDKCLIADTNHVKARLMKSALRFYQGDRNSFDDLMNSDFKKHPFTRSFAWAFNLPNLPQLHFDKWHFFDYIIKKSIISKPFYEFGVWKASSFKYLIKAFKKGYGFDTFTGLPEDWNVKSHVEKKGSYTNNGDVPNIKGGEFIVGEFENTLPVFFSKTRPIASVINFDADLYSSTICALTFSKQVIDKDTILIFDEFIMNDSWEQDESKALNEFCSVNQCSYEVIAISFFSKQVAVKLIGI